MKIKKGRIKKHKEDSGNGAKREERTRSRIS